MGALLALFVSKMSDFEFSYILECLGSCKVCMSTQKSVLSTQNIKEDSAVSCLEVDDVKTYFQGIWRCGLVVKDVCALPMSWVPFLAPGQTIFFHYIFIELFTTILTTYASST